MNKLLSCHFNMDTNRVEARFKDGTTLAIDCIAVEDECGNTPTAGTGRGAGVPDGRAPEMHRNGVVAAAGRRAGRHAALQPWAGQ